MHNAIMLHYASADSTAEDLAQHSKEACLKISQGIAWCLHSCTVDTVQAWLI